MRMFRLLRADEIECRVSTVNEKGCSLLLYKDARCDMNILDETVGAMNWQKKYCRDNANCSVGIYCSERDEWIWKEDTGTESFTEKEKGLASDSFKRACFNWGIGRELYTAPFIWITADKVKLVPKGKGTGLTTYDRFDVRSIGYDDNGKINHLEIAKKGEIVFRMGKAKQTPQSDEQADEENREDIRRQFIDDKKVKALAKHLKDNGIQIDTVCALYKVENLHRITENQHANIVNHIEELKEFQDGMQGKTG